MRVLNNDELIKVNGGLSESSFDTLSSSQTGKQLIEMAVSVYNSTGLGTKPVNMEIYKNLVGLAEDNDDAAKNVVTELAIIIGFLGDGTPEYGDALTEIGFKFSKGLENELGELEFQVRDNGGFLSVGAFSENELQSIEAAVAPDRPETPGLSEPAFDAFQQGLELYQEFIPFALPEGLDISDQEVVSEFFRDEGNLKVAQQVLAFVALADFFGLIDEENFEALEKDSEFAATSYMPVLDNQGELAAIAVSGTYFDQSFEARLDIDMIRGLAELSNINNSSNLAA